MTPINKYIFMLVEGYSPNTVFLHVVDRCKHVAKVKMHIMLNADCRLTEIMGGTIKMVKILEVDS